MSIFSNKTNEHKFNIASNLIFKLDTVQILESLFLSLPVFENFEWKNEVFEKDQHIMPRIWLKNY